MREIIITTDEAPEAVIGRVKNLAEEYQWPFAGDQNSGDFEALGVVGNYQFVAGNIHITITSKPFFYPWPVVETKIREFFG